MNAKREVIDKSADFTDLSPKECIEEYTALMNRLIIVAGDDKLSQRAQTDSTTLININIRVALNSKQICL